jgi:hypothetical protein
MSFMPNLHNKAVDQTTTKNQNQDKTEMRVDEIEVLENMKTEFKHLFFSLRDQCTPKHIWHLSEEATKLSCID